jgi:hypothetical protein
LLNEAIQYALTGAVDIDVVLAIFILTTGLNTPKLPSCARLIAIAYDVGRSIGMEANTLAGLEMGEELCEAWWRERYEEMLLVCLELP